MLTFVEHEETVCAPIEGLDLVRRFAAVLPPLGWQPVAGTESQLGEVRGRLHITRSSDLGFR